MSRKRLLITAAGALLAIAIAGGVAYATIPGPGNVYNACMLKGLGTIRLIDKSLPSTNLMSRCTDRETEISWNQAGQPGPAGTPGARGEPGPPGNDGANGTNGTDGKDGVSVSAASEPAGANCAGGGVQLTAVNGVTYVCNGKDGVDGRDGANGADGHDGVSVTSAPEPAGSNCVNGGSKFTAPNGVTYACNGADGQGGGGGLASLNDLQGLACTGAGGLQGTTQVAVAPNGDVTIRCAGVAVTLGIAVHAHCLSVLPFTCQTATVSVAIAGGGSVGSCEAVGSLSGVVTNNCQYSVPSGTNVVLTASVPGTPDWSGDCASAGTNTTCNLTMSTSKNASLDYD
jgi:hypothetical protein